MDIYDQEVERLTKLCEGKSDYKVVEILTTAWAFQFCNGVHSPLFDGCTDRRDCGPCVTQLKEAILYNNMLRLELVDSDIVKMITENDKIPTTPENLTVEILPEFAKIQRYVNERLGRSAPQTVAV